MNFFNKYKDLFGVPEVHAMPIYRMPPSLNRNSPSIIICSLISHLCPPTRKLYQLTPNLGIWEKTITNLSRRLKALMWLWDRQKEQCPGRAKISRRKRKRTWHQWQAQNPKRPAHSWSWTVKNTTQACRTSLTPIRHPKTCNRCTTPLLKSEWHGSKTSRSIWPNTPKWITSSIIKLRKKIKRLAIWGKCSCPRPKILCSDPMSMIVGSR